MTTHGLERHRNYGSILERHERDKRLKRIQRAFTYFLLVLLLILLIWWLGRWEDRTAGGATSLHSAEVTESGSLR
jgi:hypothetical protein